MTHESTHESDFDFEIDTDEKSVEPLWLQYMPDRFENQGEIKRFAKEYDVPWKIVEQYFLSEGEDALSGVVPAEGKSYGSPTVSKTTDPSDTESIASSASSAERKKKKVIVVAKQKKKDIEDEPDKKGGNGKTQARARAFAVTDFTRDIDFWKAVVNNNKVDYVLACQEICEKTGKKHWQSYIHFTNARTESATRKLLAPRHVEMCYGDPRSNINYCKKGLQSKNEWLDLKEKGPNWGKDLNIKFEHGTEPAPGKRTDIEAMYDLIKKKVITNPAQIADENPGLYCRYGKNLEKMLTFTQDKFTPRTWKTEVHCVTGKAGIGKSNRIVFLECEKIEGANLLPESERLVKFKGTIDWITITGDKKAPFMGGYTGAEAVCFDDFNPDLMDIPYWLTLTDRNPMQVNTKGGFMNWNPKRIYFTSNADPSLWWGGWSPQIERRFTTIEEVECLEQFTDMKPIRRKVTLANPLDSKGTVLDVKTCEPVPSKGEIKVSTSASLFEKPQEVEETYKRILSNGSEVTKEPTLAQALKSMPPDQEYIGNQWHTKKGIKVANKRETV